jgi:arabinan endo-1,5-alpha-L-arabinosidase
MIAFTLSLLALASSFLATVVAQPGPGYVTGDIAVHDPTMCKDKNGKWFLFCAFQLGIFCWCAC